MKLLSLGLKNYRNLSDVSFDFGTSKILIIGKNAQGKTNILESIYYLSNLKSNRTSNNFDLIKFGENSLEISAVLEKNNTQIEMDYALSQDKKKIMKLNKVITKRPSEFKHVLKTVLFASSDLMLLRGTPEDRRNWLDTAISQIYPAYDERLSKYNKIRIQKNNLLKDGFNETLFDVYNEQLVITGSNIIYLRKKFLKEIEKIAKEKHLQISEKENLSISYDCSFLDEIDCEIEQISQKFLTELQARKEEEIRRFQAVVGPHRDDILFEINGQNSTKFASQGQQRTVVLSLKLAELEIVREKTSQAPILLLDDVLAELDDLRQNYLLKTIDGSIQTVITSIDTLLFDEEFLKGVKIYKIENGSILY